jgi:NDP-sugar pyrophosphorylase family protein
MIDVFLLGAGYGKRLRPLTESVPKPLVSLHGKPLIGWNLELISMAGIQRVVVNTHHLAEQLEAYLGTGESWGLDLAVSREKELLDTGGGLKHAWGKFSSSRIMTWNSDIFLDPVFVAGSGAGPSDYERLVSVSCDTEKKPLVTVLVRDDAPEVIESYGSLGVSSEGRVVEFLGTRFVDQPVHKRVMFAGISIISKEVKVLLDKNPEVFSLTRDLFSQVLHESADKEIGGIWVSNCGCYWNDIGTIDRLEDASKQMSSILRLQQKT